MSALGRARQPYILKINYCRRPRSLHLKISRDLKLMNFLQQFELHSTSIKFSSGLNQPLRLLLAFSNLAAPREVRGRNGPEAGGAGRGEAAWGTGGKGSPLPWLPGLCVAWVSDLEPDFRSPSGSWKIMPAGQISLSAFPEMISTWV